MAIELTSEILRLTVLAGLTLAGILAIFLWMKDPTKKVSYLRIFIQTVSEIAVFFVISYSRWLTFVLVILLLMPLVFGRLYCGWICPFGFYQDLVSVLRKSLKTRYRNLPERLNRNLHRLRYVILVMFLVSPFILAGPIDPQLWPLATFSLGPFNPWRILLGPMITVIAPWKVLYGSNLNYPYVDQIVHYSSGDYVLINVFTFIALTVIGSFIFRRFWCRFCPTGASIAIVNRFRGFKWAPVIYLDKDEEKCTKCGICKRVCPVQVTEVYEQKGGKIGTSMCMLCLRCVEMCPYEECLKVKAARKTLFKSRNWLEPSKTE